MNLSLKLMSKFAMKAGVHVKVLNKWFDISHTFQWPALQLSPSNIGFVVEKTTYLNVFRHPTIHRQCTAVSRKLMVENFTLLDP